MSNFINDEVIIAGAGDSTYKYLRDMYTDMMYVSDNTAKTPAEIWRHYIETGSPIHYHENFLATATHAPASVTAPCTKEEAGVIIRAAATRIEKYGWIQGSLHAVDGYCILGAMPASRLATAAAEMFLGWLIAHGEYCGSIPEWNDQAGRTKEEVLLHMHKFADEMAPILHQPS